MPLPQLRFDLPRPVRRCMIHAVEPATAYEAPLRPPLSSLQTIMNLESLAAFDTSVLRAVLSDFYITSTQWYVLMIEYQVGFAWHLSKMVMIPCKLTNLCSFARHVRVHVVLVHQLFRCLDGRVHLDPPLERLIATTSSPMPLAMSQPRTMSNVSSLGANIPLHTYNVF